MEGEGLGDLLLLLRPLCVPMLDVPIVVRGLGATKTEASVALERLLCCLMPVLSSNWNIEGAACCEFLEDVEVGSQKEEKIVSCDSDLVTDEEERIFFMDLEVVKLLVSLNMLGDICWD